MNPASMIKLMKAKKTFNDNHPKFFAFLNDVFRGGIPVDTIMEITVTKPGMTSVTTNIKVKESDLELFNELKEIAK